MMDRGALYLNLGDAAYGLWGRQPSLALGLACGDAFEGLEYRDALVNHSNMLHAGSAVWQFSVVDNAAKGFFSLAPGRQ